MSLLPSSSSPSFVRSFIVVVAVVTGPGVVSPDLAVGVNTCNPPCEQLLAGVVTGVVSFVMVWGAAAVRCCCGAPRMKSNCNGKKTTHTCGEAGPKKTRDLLDECFGGEESVVFPRELLDELFILVQSVFRMSGAADLNDEVDTHFFKSSTDMYSSSICLA
jgi:hypothetical protein